MQIPNMKAYDRQSWSEYIKYLRDESQGLDDAVFVNMVACVLDTAYCLGKLEGAERIMDIDRKALAEVIV